MKKIYLLFFLLINQLSFANPDIHRALIPFIDKHGQISIPDQAKQLHSLVSDYSQSHPNNSVVIVLAADKISDKTGLPDFLNEQDLNKIFSHYRPNRKIKMVEDLAMLGAPYNTRVFVISGPYSAKQLEVACYSATNTGFFVVADQNEPQIALTHAIKRKPQAKKDINEIIGGLYGDQIIREMFGIINQPTSSPMNIKTSTNISDSSINCPICLSQPTAPVKLSCDCSAIFCSSCIDQHLQNNKSCPSCNKKFGITQGNQPADGTMRVWARYDLRLRGHDEDSIGSIKCHFSFPKGRQKQNDPNPNKPYSKRDGDGFVTINGEGLDGLLGIYEAFEHQCLFTIGTSRRSGKEGITFNDIHLKTNPHGGSYGFPQTPKDASDYFTDLMQELANHGIVVDPSSSAQLYGNLINKGLAL